MIASDTNVLIYAVSFDEDPRNDLARAVLRDLFPRPSIIPLQVLGEFLNVAIRRGVADVDVALARIAEWVALVDAAPTRVEDFGEAARLAHRFNLQFFDALICAVSRRVGATWLLSEDMQDGMVVDGVTVLNPFAAANRQTLDGLLER